MSGREGGKLKPLKQPKKDKKELEDVFGGSGDEAPQKDETEQPKQDDSDRGQESDSDNPDDQR